MTERKTVNITIDGKKIAAPVDQAILQTALDNGIKIPYFCYHPNLRPDGNCRMCLVEVEKIKKPVISCLTYPNEGMVVNTNTEKIRAARKAVLEFILVNHPLDCPICDKVGECELQANYFDCSGMKSSFLDAYAKVRAPKLEKFGERILFDSERCIKCSRCARFTQEVSKSYWLGLVDRGVHSTVCAVKDVRDPYSDCVADICPVGALTKTNFRFKSRVFMLKRAESVCPLCSRGCNIYLDYKYGQLYRTMPRCNREINRSWMCNAGRDMFAYLNRERCTAPIYQSKEIAYEEAFQQLLAILQQYRTGKNLAIASSFGSNEEIAGFVQVFGETLSSQVYYKSDNTLNQKEYPSDSFLITGDKNPSRYTLEKTHKLAEISDATSLDDYDLLLVWGEGLAHSLSQTKREELFARSKVKVLVTPFHEGAMGKYDLVIPARTFVEKKGSFTNCDGKKSQFGVAFVSNPRIEDEEGLWHKLSLALADKVACGA
jgi:NADH-quinone oxidoreductase subunit G